MDLYDRRPSSPLSLPRSRSSSVSSVSTASSDTRPYPPRVYVYARLKHGEPPVGTPAAYQDLEYWLRVEHLPEVVNIPLHLSGIGEERAMRYRWSVAFTRSPVFDTMELPAPMVKVLRGLLMFLYSTAKAEKGFTQDLYKHVGAAIAYETDYAVPPVPYDQTQWLLALLKYIEQEVGPDALKDRECTPGEIRVAEELTFGCRTYDVNTWVWPLPADLVHPTYQYVGRAGVARDRRHRSRIAVDGSTFPELPPEVRRRIRQNE